MPFADSGNHATRKERMPPDTQAAVLCERTAGGYIPSSLWDEDRNPPMPRPWTRRQLERFPELSRFAPDDAFAQRCCRPLRAGWWNAALLNATVVFLWSIVWGVVCFLWLASSGSPRLPAPSPVGVILASLGWIAGLVVAVWFSRWLVRGYLAWHLRTELRRRGIPVCLKCGYEGGDIAAPRCPECGAPAA